MDDSRPSRVEQSDVDHGPMLVVVGWILILGAIAWLWVEFITRVWEASVWIAVAVAGIGYLVQRAGNRQVER